MGEDGRGGEDVVPMSRSLSDRPVTMPTTPAKSKGSSSARSSWSKLKIVSAVVSEVQHDGLQHHVVVGESWDEVVAEMVIEVTRKKLVRGQVVRIDAQQGAEANQLQLVVYWHRVPPKRHAPPLHLRHLGEEREFHGDWSSFYDNVTKSCHSFCQEQIVSITFSCGPGNKAASFVFYDTGEMEPGKDSHREPAELYWKQTQGKTWEEAADRVCGTLATLLVGPSQIVSIDAHEKQGRNLNSGAAGTTTSKKRTSQLIASTAAVENKKSTDKKDLMFVVFCAEGPPVENHLTGYLIQRHSWTGWPTLHANCARDHSLLGRHAGPVLSLTGSRAWRGDAVNLIFYAEEKVQPDLIPASKAHSKSIRVLSFNLKACDGNRFEALSTALQHTRADLVALQEADNARIVRLCSLCLGFHFDYYAAARLAVLSRFPLERLHAGPNFLCSHALIGGGKAISIANVRLPPDPYAPYILHVQNRGVKAALDVESTTQLPALKPALAVMQKEREAGFPCLLVGSFAAVSTLDYCMTPGQKKEDNKNEFSKHESGDAQDPASPKGASDLKVSKRQSVVAESVRWPCSEAVAEAGFIDTFIAHNPKHLGAWRKKTPESRGVTWSVWPSEEHHNCFERVDFIYASQEFTVEDSKHVDGHASGVTEWPSPHKAVLSVLRLPKPEKDSH